MQPWTSIAVAIISGMVCAWALENGKKGLATTNAILCIVNVGLVFVHLLA